MRERQLHEIYADLVREVASTDQQGDDGFLFSSAVLPPPPPAFTTDRIICKKGGHIYNSRHYVDQLALYGHHDTIQMLGLWILSMLFHEKPATSILCLSHSASDIKSIVCRFDYEDLEGGQDLPGYVATPSHYRYYSDSAERYPWLGVRDPYELPQIFLTNSSDQIYRDQDLAARDTLLGFGRDRSAIRMATLLLDIGASRNDDLDIDLEGELGFRGVAPGSVELQIVVPGTFRWIFDAELPPIQA